MQALSSSSFVNAALTGPSSASNSRNAQFASYGDNKQARTSASSAFLGKQLNHSNTVAEKLQISGKVTAEYYGSASIGKVTQAYKDQDSTQPPQQKSSSSSFASSSSSSVGKQQTRICILGGGFGGLYTALRLSSLPWPQGNKPKITLVDQNDRFVFKPLLYELVTGEMNPDEVAPTFSSLLRDSGVEFLQGQVEAIAPEGTEGEAELQAGKWSQAGGRVKIQAGEDVQYDWLVLALGAKTRLDMAPGVKDFALPFATLDDAERLDMRLSELEKQSGTVEVAVVGGGVSGVELAATVAERMGPKAHIRLLNSGQEVMQRNPKGQRDDAVKALRSYGVEILPNCRVTKCKQVEGEESVRPTSYALDLEGGSTVEADLVLWTAGQDPVVPESPKPVGAYGMPLAKGGEVVTDSFLRVRRHPQMFALGDAALAMTSQGEPLPATAQVAFQAADYVGWNLWASLNERPLLPFRYQHLGDMMALGTWDAAVALPMDLLNVNGRVASVLRRAAYVYRQPTVDQAVKVGFGFVRYNVGKFFGGMRN